MKAMEDRVCSLVFCRQTPPEWVEIQSPSSSPTYNHCLDNFNLDPSGMWMWVLRRINSFSILTNACLVAFASDFVNKLVYKFYYSPDGSIMGYTNFSLSYMDVSQFEIAEEDSRYFGYREPPDGANPYALTSVFWSILAAKIIFVCIFTLLVMLINWLLRCLIPHAPRQVGETDGSPGACSCSMCHRNNRCNLVILQMHSTVQKRIEEWIPLKNLNTLGTDDFSRNGTG
ncbi:Anoctamin-2 [Taenia solium]|eukprot:TsM_001069400 transcript=TsM_001069400 gene=TsM_001069400